MLSFYVMLAIYALVFFSYGYYFTQRKYLVNLLDEDATKLRRHRVSRLELKRFAVNQYLGSSLRSSPSPKRKEVSLNAPDQNHMGMYNIVTDELKVLAYVGNGRLAHDVFTCPYSAENKAWLAEIVARYNET